MAKLKKSLWVVLALCLVLTTAFGCASSSSPSVTAQEEAAPAPAAVEAPQTSYEMDSAGTDNGSWKSSTGEAATSEQNQENQNYGGHKIIKNAYLSLETENFDDVVEHITERAGQMGGYISSSNISGRKPENYQDSGRYASIELRIPQEKMEAFLTDAKGVADVINEQTGGQDITSDYFDTESHLKVLTTQRERILALLEKADKMEDIIALETELSRLNYEIESLTTNLKRWDDLVAYSTVNVDVSEIPPASAAASASEKDIGTRMSNGFVRTLSGLKVFFENFAVVVVVLSPVLVIIAAIVLITLWIVRRKKRRKAKKMQDNGPANMPEKQ